MTEEKKSGDDMRPIGAMICLGAGIWLLSEGLLMGGAWRIGGGFLFIVFGLVRGWYLLKEHGSGPQMDPSASDAKAHTP